MHNQTASWLPVKPSDTEADTAYATYRGWEIKLIIPNGGILGASIVRGDEAYQMPSEGLGQNLYQDDSWHIWQAKAYIDSRNLEGDRHV